ncbi:antibiotic biosynthesis monooxygenase [Streptomyces sp. NBC_01635]|uniref:putative quinol monooxygenase n=1 Tax=Streptomyces sp. NBC_01635 TaxID=2975904 RepID=UPI003865ECFA|nr:antibiotic biosynthesis monooxygenase [Streptomyces sp. NBC_01635]
MSALRDGVGEAFDELVREAAAAVLEREPGTLAYACSEVGGAPNQRLFFELYTDRVAFDDHGRQPHVRHFRSASGKYAGNGASTASDRMPASPPPHPHSGSQGPDFRYRP